MDFVFPKAYLFLGVCIWYLGKCILCDWILLHGAHWLSADGMNPKVTISAVNRSYHQCGQNYKSQIVDNVNINHQVPLGAKDGVSWTTTTTAAATTTTTTTTEIAKLRQMKQQQQ